MSRLRSKHFVRARTVLRRPTAAPRALRRPAAYTSRAACHETNRQHVKKSLPLVLRPTKAGAPVRPERREAAGPTLPEVSRWSEAHSRSIHASPDNSVRLTSEYGSRSIRAGPDSSVRLTSEYGSRSIHAGPDNSVRLTSEYGSRSIQAGPDNSVRLTSESGSRSMPAQIIPFVLPASDVLAHLTRNHDDCQL